jgi:hypothetical protein
MVRKKKVPLCRRELSITANYSMMVLIHHPTNIFKHKNSDKKKGAQEIPTANEREMSFAVTCIECLISAIACFYFEVWRNGRSENGHRKKCDQFPKFCAVCLKSDKKRSVCFRHIENESENL